MSSQRNHTVVLSEVEISFPGGEIFNRVDTLMVEEIIFLSEIETASRSWNLSSGYRLGPRLERDFLRI